MHLNLIFMKSCLKYVKSEFIRLNFGCCSIALPIPYACFGKNYSLIKKSLMNL